MNKSKKKPISINRFEPKFGIRKDDIVIVTSGADKGKEGKVLMVYPEGRVLVDQVNLVSKATRPNPNQPNGGIVKMESPINISNVSLKDPKTGKATRVGRRLEDGKLVRYAKKSGEVID
jgi:large subunit ribosomal protein L24